MHNRCCSIPRIALFWVLVVSLAMTVFASSRSAASGTPVLFAAGSISTAEYETTPTFTPDFQRAYFMRFSAESGGRAIFSSKYVNGSWTKAEATTLPPNSGGPAISPDGSKIFFWSIAPGAWTPHLWVAERDGVAWSQPRPLGAPLDGNGELSPSIAANGTLYFTAIRKDSSGGNDVYRSRLVDGEYSVPENLAGVNSQFDEVSVAVAPDESFLVLASQGRSDSRGESDLYVSMRQDRAWSLPVRLGPEVNTSENESNPQISADRRYLFFTRAGDIHRLETASFLITSDKRYQGPWIERVPMPTPRVWGRAAVWNGKVYVANGLSGWGQEAHGVNSVEEYDPIANRWVRKANTPAGAEQSLLAVGSESLRLFAGKGGSSYRYSSSDDRWFSNSDTLPWLADQNTGVVQIGERLFALTSVWTEGGWVSSFVEYDTAHSTWTTRRSPPLGAPGSQMAIANERIYLFGAGEKENGVQEYDPVRASWTSKSPMPTARVEVRFASIKGKIYAVGGHVPGGAVTDAVEEYDTVHDSWRSLAPLPEPRWGAAVAAVDGKLYVFGGSPDTVNSAPASGKAWEYNPDQPLH